MTPEVQQKAKVRGRVAALDVGDVWTGVALSDETRSIARPVSVVASGELHLFIEEMSGEDTVSEIVVGVPKNLKGEVGHQARRVLDKLDVLRDEFPQITFVEWDERFTTRMAAEVGAAPVRKSGRGSRSKGGTKKKVGQRGSEGRVDHLAAARMLQEYLESRGNV